MALKRYDEAVSVCETGSLWKKVAFFKVARELSAFMQPIDHSRVQSSPSRVPNQIYFIDQISALQIWLSGDRASW